MLRKIEFVLFVCYRCLTIWIKVAEILYQRQATPRTKREDTGRFYKRLCEELGGTFVKVGQALAMRQDFLTASECEALSELLDRVRPFNSVLGRNIVEKQLKGKISDFFSEFSDEPVAAASFSQVYKARTHAGELVAVKVMRPNMELIVQADTTLLLLTAKALNLFGTGKRIGILTLAREVVKVLQDELNYPREGKYLQIFQDHVRKFEFLEVPKYFPKLSGSKVLTMSFLEGVTLRDYLTQWRANPNAELRDSEGKIIDGPLVGSRIYEMTMHSVFELGFYHADLHPGNIILLPGNRIGIIDFGIVGVLDKELREKNLKYIEALADGRFEDAANIYATIVKPHTRADYAGLKMDMLILLKAWSVATADPNASFKEKSSGTVLNDSVEFARRHRFYLPQNAVLYYKTVMMIDHLNIELNPSYDSIGEAEKFIYEHRIHQLSHALTYERMQRYWVGMVESLADYPAAISNGLKFLQNLEPRRSRSPLVLVAEQLILLLRNLLVFAGIALPFVAIFGDVDWVNEMTGFEVILLAIGLEIGAAQLNNVHVRLISENPPTD